MKKIICFILAMVMLTTPVLAATYYDVTVEGLTYSEKEDLVEWLESEDMEYDVESYNTSSSNTSNSTKKEVIVEGLSSSQKNTLVNWLKNQDYEYTTKTKNGYYYVTIEYTNSTKDELMDYLDTKWYDNTDNSKIKELVVEELTTSQKNTLTSWLENRDYDYSTKTKNGYYYVTIEYTSSTKSTLINYLDNKDYEYDSSNTSNSNMKELVVEELSTSQKNTLTSWLKNRDYDYTTKTKNGYYYVTIEYTSSTKSTLIDYLDNKNYEYDSSNNSNSSDRTGKAYLVADGYLWYADAESEDIEKVDEIYSPEYVLFTKDGGIAYINDSKKGMYIEDLDDPTESEQIANSVSSIKTNSSRYAISFKGTGSKTTEIDVDDFNNEEMTVYIVKSNTLYSLSSKNKLTKLKSLKSVSSSNYSNVSNIGFSEWGELVFVDSSGVCFFNEEIDVPDEIETLKDQNGYTVKAKSLTVKNGIVQSLTLTNGSIVKLEAD